MSVLFMLGLDRPEGFQPVLLILFMFAENFFWGLLISLISIVAQFISTNVTFKFLFLNLFGLV